MGEPAVKKMDFRHCDGLNFFSQIFLEQILAGWRRCEGS